MPKVLQGGVQIRTDGNEGDVSKIHGGVAEWPREYQNRMQCIRSYVRNKYSFLG